MIIKIEKKDIISWGINNGTFVFKVKDKDQGKELKNVILSQSEQQEIQDMHATKFGGKIED